MAKKILIDIDLLLENITSVWVNYLTKNRGFDFEKVDLYNWSLADTVSELSPEEIIKVMTDEELWEHVHVKKGAVDNIKRLKDDGHTVAIVAPAHPKSLNLKLYEVLFKNYPYLHWRDIVVTSREQSINFDVLISASVYRLRGGKYHKILFSDDFNNSVDAEKYGMVRINNWNEAYYAVGCYLWVVESQNARQYNLRVPEGYADRYKEIRNSSDKVLLFKNFINQRKESDKK